MVNLARTESNIVVSCRNFLQRVLKNVTSAPPSMNQWDIERPVNLTAQPVDVYLYEVGERVEGLIPDMLGDLFAANHLPGVP
jgi:hypothetical protein